MRSRGPAIAGIVLAVVTTAVYLIGSNRSFGYDAAATFANFIATPSLWDAFAVRSVLPTIELKSIASNDHVLLSFLGHLIYSATGSRSAETCEHRLLGKSCSAAWVLQAAWRILCCALPLDKPPRNNSHD